MAGVTVFLDWNDNGILDEFEPRAVTDSQGRFIIDNVPPGSYELRQVIPDGYRQVSPTEPLSLNRWRYRRKLWMREKGDVPFWG